MEADMHEDGAGVGLPAGHTSYTAFETNAGVDNQRLQLVMQSQGMLIQAVREQGKALRILADMVDELETEIGVLRTKLTDLERNPMLPRKIGDAPPKF